MYVYLLVGVYMCECVFSVFVYIYVYSYFCLFQYMANINVYEKSMK